MTQPQRDDEIEQVWRTLAAAARRAPDDAAAPLDVERVVAAASLGARCARPQPPLSKSEERLVSWAALFAVAASLLLTVACWSDVEAALAPQPAIFELPLELEPL